VSKRQLGSGRRRWTSLLHPAKEVHSAYSREIQRYSGGTETLWDLLLSQPIPGPHLELVVLAACPTYPLPFAQTFAKEPP
jgi:hypothetical protein